MCSRCWGLLPRRRQQIWLRPQQAPGAGLAYCYKARNARPYKREARQTARFDRTDIVEEARVDYISLTADVLLIVPYSMSRSTVHVAFGGSPKGLSGQST